MIENFEQMEADVEQKPVDKKCAKIERKNLLTENENLLADCLSSELLYSVMNAVNTVSRFSELHDAYIVEQAHKVELEDGISKLKHKIQKDNHSEMIKHFSNLEIDHLNLKLKYQKLKEHRILDFKALDFQNIELTEHVTALQEQTERFRAENEKVKQHYKELYDSIKIMLLALGMYAIDVEPILPRNRNNREVHLDYLKHLKESVDTLHKYKRRNKREKAISTSIPTIAETQTIDASVKYTTISSNQQDPNKDWGSNIPNSPSSFVFKCRTVRFGNDHFGAIMGYGDYMIGDSVISRVYYVEGLGHNVDCVELLKGSRGLNLYTISVEGMMKSYLICLLSKASKNKSWLWHRRLNHLNFGTINDLARKDLVRGLPRLKFEKDHLRSAYQLGKSKKYTHKPISKNTIMEVLHTLRMDFCGPMRVHIINGKRYILSSLMIIQDLHGYIRTNNGTELVNQVLTEFYERVGISHQKSISRTPQQNGVVERRNRTLVEAARTMLIFSKALIALCYPTNDNKDLGKLKAKADIGIFVGYAPNRKGYRIYNKRTR
ncbi:retrovirus-related pol polyprotein from transposon TNT 1-94 [Tanacetum coccineum]